MRNFQVLSEKGEELIKAVSMWLMVNTEDRRLVRPQSYMQDFPLNSERLFDENPGKIKELSNPVRFEPAAVSFTETDMNRHMNNVSYIDRIINTYDFDFLMSHQISKFEINFLKEAVPGESIVIQKEEVSGNLFLHNIVHEANGLEMVRTKIEWH